MLIMWTDTKNPKFFPDFGCRTVGWQQKNQHFLSDFGCRSVGGQQKNQSLKEGVICYGRRTFLLNLSIYSYIRNIKMDKSVLDTIMCIDTRARMIGNYIGPLLELYTEKVTGTTTACLGLIEKGDCYIHIVPLCFPCHGFLYPGFTGTHCIDGFLDQVTQIPAQHIRTPLYHFSGASGGKIAALIFFLY